MTGIETAAWMPEIISGSDRYATPVEGGYARGLWAVGFTLERGATARGLPLQPLQRGALRAATP